MDLGANLLNDFLVQNQPVWPKEEAQCQSAAIQPFIDSATNFDSDLLDDDLLLFLPTDVKYSLNEQISDEPADTDINGVTDSGSMVMDEITALIEQPCKNATDCANTPNRPNETAAPNIEWARYLTSIDDIVNDVDGGDRSLPLESLSATLTNPLEIHTDDLHNQLQHRVIDAFELSDYLKLVDGLPPSTQRGKQIVQNERTDSTNRENASLYLIPLSDAVTRYHPFDMCKEFIEKLQNQPRYLQKLLDEIKTGAERQIIIRFHPKYEKPKAPVKLTLKEKLALIQKENVEIPIIRDIKKKRSRKAPPIFTKK